METGSIKQRIVVFAGAGASKAVDSVNYPTTVEFFDRLPPTIRENVYFQFVEDYLKETKGRPIDIEEILWGLQTLLDLCRNAERGDGLIGHALSDHRLARLVSPRWDHGNLPPSFPALSSEFSKVISLINAEVYDLYGAPPDAGDIRDNWVKLLSAFFQEDILLDVFTTNYDIVIETAIDGILGTKAASYYGLTGGRHKTLDIERWSSGSDIETGLLTKLHGSLDWKVRNDKIYAGDPVFTGDHGKQGIIYPGFKGASNKIFFKPFHDYLGRCLASADMAIFIGFAFRDDYINESIRNNISSDAKVIVLNPDPSAIFPYRRIKAKHMARGFEAATSNEVIKLASSLRAASTPQARRVRLV